MGSTKARIMDAYEANRQQAIYDLIPVDIEVEIDSPEWDEYAQKFDDHQAYMEEKAEFESAQDYEQELQEEIEWRRDHPNMELFDNFSKELMLISSNITSANTSTLKMKYAYAVTLLESYLSDTIKSLIVINNTFVKNAICNIPALSQKSVSLNRYYEEDFLTRQVIEYLSGLLYHKIHVVKKTYQSILNVDININIASVSKIMAVRHDIVHRNGKTVDDIPVELTPEILSNSIKDILTFISAIDEQVTETLLSNDMGSGN